MLISYWQHTSALAIAAIASLAWGWAMGFPSFCWWRAYARTAFIDILVLLNGSESNITILYLECSGTCDNLMWQMCFVLLVNLSMCLMEIFWARNSPVITGLLVARLLVAGWRSITSNCLLHRIAGHAILSTSIAIRLYDPLLIDIVLMFAFIEDNLGSFFANSALRKRTQT